MPTKVIIETAMKFEKDLNDIRAGIQKPWKTTGWRELDEYYKISEGQLNVVSGYPGSGKSEWVDSIMVHQAMEPGVSVCYYSPENWPSSILVQKFIEKRAAKELKDIPKKEYQELLIWAEIKFKILSASIGSLSVESILESTKKLIEGGVKLKHLVIDPWNECDSSRPNGMTETDYIGERLAECRRFARKWRINIWIVCHPAKPPKDKNGNIHPPTLYDLAGSAHWYNKCDNGFIVHRPDKDNSNAMILFIRKIKNRYFGKTGNLDFEFIWKGGNFKVLSEARKLEVAIKHQPVKKNDPLNNWAAKENKKRLDNNRKIWDNHLKENRDERN